MLGLFPGTSQTPSTVPDMLFIKRRESGGHPDRGVQEADGNTQLLLSHQYLPKVVLSHLILSFPRAGPNLVHRTVPGTLC